MARLAMANAMVTKATIEATLALVQPPHGCFLTPILSTITILTIVYPFDFLTSLLSIICLQPQLNVIVVHVNVASCNLSG
ncbi:hypothetical protein GUJ93_ZPchr0002g23507 [Zizania palustris]|uniref:Uncharacterized protein n=1 Tax=Zizania palustris TaxID=103762 RepID=A0A8J5VBU1_ZIZPA|nr:hypothetical protein GUJ93_ZPchr0002g23507 [Zizania palustris]